MVHFVHFHFKVKFLKKSVDMQMIQSENEKQRLKDEVVGSSSRQGFSDLRK
jgi:hypothetical protein